MGRGRRAKAVRAHEQGYGYQKRLHEGAHLIKTPKVSFEKKAEAPTQMLSQQYLEFGQKARNWCVSAGPRADVCVYRTPCACVAMCLSASAHPCPHRALLLSPAPGPPSSVGFRLLALTNRST